jgi:hypothetical protein
LFAESLSQELSDLCGVTAEMLPKGPHLRKSYLTDSEQMDTEVNKEVMAIKANGTASLTKGTVLHCNLANAIILFFCNHTVYNIFLQMV